MHDLIGAMVSRRRAVFAAAMLAGGVAGAAILATPGTALASTQVATGTSVTGASQEASFWNAATLKVSVSVTAQSGSQAPAGEVVVADGNGTCHATLTPGSGAVSSGSCELRYVTFGPYTLKASYLGSTAFGSSVSNGYPVVVGLAPKLTADTPARSAAPGSDYRYTFRASGNPAPSYALAPGAPKWLWISSSTGRLSGRVPPGISSFTYSVVASNGVGSATAGPYTVYMSRPGHPGARVTTELNCPRAVVSGQSGRCTLTVTDRSWGPARNVSAVIGLPSRLHARFCWGCRLNGNTASWWLGTLGPWQSKSVTVYFTARYQPASWARHPVQVTVAGIAQWGQRAWWQRPASSYSAARVTIFPRGGWTW
jgi:hypothetical protein